MTKTKRALAALLAIVLLVALLSTTAFAAGDGCTIKLSQSFTGRNYSFYRILGLEISGTGDAYVYTLIGDPETEGTWAYFIKNAQDGSGNPYFTVSGGKVTPNNNYTGDAPKLLAQNAAAYAKAHSLTAAHTAAGSDAEVIVTSDAAYGYYLMTYSDFKGIPALDSLLPNKKTIAFEDKNEKASLTKTFINTEGEVIDAPDGAIVGDEVKFRIVVTIGTDGQFHMIHDKMTGLELVSVDSVSANISGVLKNLTVGTEYTVHTPHTCSDAGCDFEVAFEDVVVFTAGDTVTIEYTTRVTAEAMDNGIENEATVDQFGIGGGGEGTEYYLFSFSLEKTDDEGNALDGATFRLYQNDKTTGIPLVKVTDAGGTYYRPAQSGEEIADLIVGTAVIKGLPAGTYYLKETAAPVGYIKDDSWKQVSLIDANADGVLDEGAVTITVKNTSGTELPSTGGVGTTIFYVAGLVLVLAAVTVLVSKKRANA